MRLYEDLDHLNSDFLFDELTRSVQEEKDKYKSKLIKIEAKKS